MSCCRLVNAPCALNLENQAPGARDRLHSCATQWQACHLVRQLSFSQPLNREERDDASSQSFSLSSELAWNCFEGGLSLAWQRQAKKRGVC